MGIPNPRFLIIERREKVLIMLSKGLSEIEISNHLNVNQSTISRDVKAIKKESQKTIQIVVSDILPFEFAKSILSLNHIIKDCWIIANDNSGRWTNKDKVNAYKLIKDTERTRFEILKNGPLNLDVVHLHEQVEQLKEEQNSSGIKGFMPPLLHSNLEDLK